MKYIKTALLYGLGVYLAVLVACFIYGLFNSFDFWHAYSPAGISSGMAYVLTVGLTLGSFVFLIAAVIGIIWAAIKWEKSQNNPSE
jgi:hypothetical protein